MSAAAAEQQHARRFLGEEAIAGVADTKAIAAGDVAAAAPAPKQLDAVSAAAIAKLLVGLLDYAARSFGGEHLKLSPLEEEKLLSAAVPVVQLYVPPEMAFGPVGILVATGAAIYGPKLMAAPPESEPSDAPAQPEA